MYILHPAEQKRSKTHKTFSGSTFSFAEMFYLHFRRIFNFIGIKGVVVPTNANFIPWKTISLIRSISLAPIIFTETGKLL